ncbi:MAG: substrate-binding domain-containing protein [Psychromonas sp.]|nr:substrate-binding domain-containing protein [Psychromonas sp.]
MPKRLSFAYLTPLFTNQMGKELYFGIKEELQEKGIDLTVFVGGSLEKGKNSWTDIAANSTYELAKHGGFDGIIIYGGAIGHLVETEQLDSFCSSFNPIPVINISLALANTPSVIISNYQGMYQLTEHLITAHQCKNFAFIKGPELHDEAEQRFKAFADALAYHQLSLDPELNLPGDFSNYAGVMAVKEIINKQSTLPDAIVCVDDDTALGVLKELKAHSISVPAEIIVTGFDDALFAKNCIPSITSVKQPFQTLGKTAALQLLRKVNGKQIAAITEVEALPIIHESCGCFGDNKPQFENSASQAITDQSLFSQEIINQYDAKLIIDHTLISNLLSSLEKISKGGSETLFYNTFNQFIEQQSDLQTKIEPILSFLVSLKTYVKNIIDEEPLATIFQQAIINIYSIIHRKTALALYQTENNYYHIDYVNQQLHQATNLEQLYDMSHQLLSEQHINSCAILLYQGEGENKKLDNLRMTFAYNKQRLPLPKSGVTTCLKETFDNFFQRNGDNVILMPLSLSDEKIGILMLEQGDTILELCQALSWHLSSIIKRLQTLQEKEQKRVQLENTLQDLRSTQQRLIESEKLASLGKLVADVAHEMNTPLGISITYSSLIVDTVGKIERLVSSGQIKKSELTEQLSILQKAGKATLFNLNRSTDLVNSFKSLSIEHDASQLRTVFIKEIIEDSLVPMRSRLNKANHQIDIVCPSHLVTHSYPKSIIQVLMSLIDNSICHAYQQDEQGRLSITAEQNNNQIKITYQDDGCGISKQDKENILEPFFTTKRNQGHVGIGLTTIYNIIKKHLHGHLKICDISSGTKIIVTFPTKIKNMNNTELN